MLQKQRNIMTKIFVLIIASILLLAMLVGCGDNVEPIRVYITTTPAANTMQENEDTTILTTARQGVSEPEIITSTDEQSSVSSSARQALTATPAPTEEVSLFELAPDSDELPVLQQSRMGIQIHPKIEQQTWELYLGEGQRLGMDWIKIQIPWRELEPQPGQFSEWFTIYVNRVVSANVNGFNVLISVVDAPLWARPTNARPDFQGPPADPQTLANFLTQFLDATKPQDNRVAAVEVWNEPNLRDREWDAVEMSGAVYFRYLEVAYNAIKAVDDDIIVISAGLAPVGDVPGAVSDRRFLQQMYDAGLAQYPDIRIGVHPYGWANAPDERCCLEDRAWGNAPVFFYQDTLFDYIDIMQRNGHDSALWITEFGWGTYDAIGANGEDIRPVPVEAPWFESVTPTEQAEYTMRAFELAQQAPLSDWVEVSILWNLNFATLPGAVENRLEQAGYSVLDASSDLRLIYFYLIKSERVP
jgi:hypothetical protein